MNTQTQAPQATSILDKPGKINALYESALKNSSDATYEAFVCGQTMSEVSFCQSGRSKSRHPNQYTPPEEQFEVWLREHCPNISFRTAYRWIDFARRVGDLLKLPSELDGLPLSDILNLDTIGLTEQQEAVVESVAFFLIDKTMAEAAAGVAFGGDEAHRVVRAHNGKEQGGTRGENRKDYPAFALSKFHDLGAHFKHWDAMDDTQRTEVKTAVRAFILGEEVKLMGRQGRPPKYKFDELPEELAKAMQEVLRERLKKA